MKFGQSIEYNRRNIFLEKSMWWNNSHETLYSKIKIEHISGSTVLSFIQIFFIVYQVESYRNKLKLSCKTLAFTSSKAFQKNIERCGVSLPAKVFAWFLKINIFLVTLYKLTIISIMSGCVYFARYWPMYALQLFLNQLVISSILKLTLSFQSSRSFYMTKKSI